MSRGERSRGGQIDVLTYNCEERRGAARREQQPCAEGSGSQVRRETGGGAQVWRETGGGAPPA